MELSRKRLKISGFLSVPFEVATETEVVRVGHGLKCERCTDIWCFSTQAAAEHQNVFHAREWPYYDGAKFHFRGQVIHLKGHKARVLKLLVDAEGKVVAVANLTTAEWRDPKQVYVMMSRLRRDVTAYGLKIVSLRHHGYHLELSGDSESL